MDIRSQKFDGLNLSMIEIISIIMFKVYVNEGIFCLLNSNKVSVHSPVITVQSNINSKIGYGIF